MSDKRWEQMTPKEMFNKGKHSPTKPSDMAVKIGLLLLLPYVLWLSKYSASYVASIHGKTIHLNYDGVMQSFHNLISNANMIVHESGHGVCYLLHCPMFITSLNGTVFQLALPLFFVYYYYKRDNMVLSALGVMWLAQNLIYVAWYMSYSQTPNLYPFFLGGAATHDFWYMFSQLGVLEYDWLIAGFVRVVAVVLLLGAYIYLLYIAFFKSDRVKIKRISRGKR